MLERKTKKYNETGIITLNAEVIGGNQETIDREISASSLLRGTVEALYESENKESPMRRVKKSSVDSFGYCPMCDALIVDTDEPCYCTKCGQKVKGSNIQSEFAIALSAGRVRVRNISTGDTEVYRINTDKEVSEAFDNIKKAIMADWSDRQDEGGGNE